MQYGFRKDSLVEFDPEEDDEEDCWGGVAGVALGWPLTDTVIRWVCSLDWTGTRIAKLFVGIMIV